MAPHTPGPWQFYKLPNGSRLPDGLGYIRPDPEDGLEICHHGDTGRSREENAANAALIEAAPELLEALRLILPMAKGYAAQHPVGSNAEYIASAETLLAKAEAA